MDIKTLEAFLMLARSLNFTKTAEQLFISQSAFSRQISRLETELGCELFTRTKRNVELTRYGKAFLEHAEIIVSEYNKGIYHLNYTMNKEGNLRIAILNDLVDDIFPQIVTDFTKENPEVKVTFSDNAMSGLISNLLHDEIDCAYTLSYDVDKIPDISSHIIWSRPLYVAMSRHHPLAHKDTLRIEDLEGCPFVIILPDTYNLGVIHINYLCKTAGFTPEIAAVASNINSLLMMVNSNVGVAITAQTAEYVSPKDVKFFPIETDNADQLLSDIALIWKTSNKNPCIQKLIDSVKATSRKVSSL